MEIGPLCDVADAVDVGRPAPLLEDLTLTVPPGTLLARLPVTGENIRRSCATKLGHLTLVRCPVMWTSDVFSGLESLTLSCFNGKRLSRDDLCRALNACQDLQCLSLDRVSFDYQEDEFRFSSVVLPKLVRMTYVDIYEPEVANLLSPIEAPQCQHFKIRACEQKPSFNSIANYTIVSSLMASAVKAKLVLSFESCEDHCKLRFSTWGNSDEHAPELDIQLDYLEWETSVLACVWGLCENMRVTVPISLKLIGSQLTLIDFAVFDKFASVAEVIIENAGDAANLFMQYLAQWTFRNSRCTWPFPNLESFSTKRCPAVTAQQLSLMLQSRYRIPQTIPQYFSTQKPKPVIELPRALASINVEHVPGPEDRRSMNKVETLAKIQALIGDGVLNWEVDEDLENGKDEDGDFEGKVDVVDAGEDSDGDGEVGGVNSGDNELDDNWFLLG